MAQDRRGTDRRGRGGFCCSRPEIVLLSGHQQGPEEECLTGGPPGHVPLTTTPRPRQPHLSHFHPAIEDRPQSFGGFQVRAGVQGATRTWLKDPLPLQYTSCRALRVRAFRRGTQGQVREPSSLGVPGVRAVLREGGFLAPRASPDAQVRSELPPATPVATLPEGWRLPCCCMPRLVLKQAPLTAGCGAVELGDQFLGFPPPARTWARQGRIPLGR